MKRTRKRLARLEATIPAGCDVCNPSAVEAAAIKLSQRLEEMSRPAYHRQRAAELCAEADRREAAEAGPSAAGRTTVAVPASHGTVRETGTDPAVASLCPQCRVCHDLAVRVSASLAAIDAARTPSDLRRLAREAVAEAERLEYQAELRLLGTAEPARARPIAATPGQTGLPKITDT